MAREGELRALYNCWFRKRLPAGERLKLPISPHRAEMYRALGEPGWRVFRSGGGRQNHDALSTSFRNGFPAANNLQFSAMIA